jgi:hypothetical protein
MDGTLLPPVWFESDRAVAARRRPIVAILYLPSSTITVIRADVVRGLLRNGTIRPMASSPPQVAVLQRD